MVVFRQDLPHAGSGYEAPNLRYFTYLVMDGVERASDQTTPIDIPDKKLEEFAKFKAPFKL